MKKSNNYLSQKELKKLGLKSFGKNVFISKDARLHTPSTISIGNNVRIDDFTIITGDVEIGDYVHIASHCVLVGKRGIMMKNFSGLSSRVNIYTATDDYSNGTSLTNPTIPLKYQKLITGPVILEEHVIIGSGSIILPSVHLMDGASVGALSLVNKGKYGGWALYAGIPIKLIKKRPKKILIRDGKILLARD